jgi:hypothetical protein
MRVPFLDPKRRHEPIRAKIAGAVTMFPEPPRERIGRAAAEIRRSTEPSASAAS